MRYVFSSLFNIKRRWRLDATLDTHETIDDDHANFAYSTKFNRKKENERNMYKVKNKNNNSKKKNWTEKNDTKKLQIIKKWVK